MEREALKLALEALESSRVFVTTREKIKHPEGTKWYDERITAIKEALAQPAQEPVAWMVYTQDGKSVYVTDNPTDIQEGQRALPLYTTPPQREWIWLSDADIAEVVDTTCQYSGGYEEYLIKKAERKIRSMNA